MPDPKINTVNLKGSYYSVPGFPLMFKKGSDMSGADTNMFNYWQQQQQNAYELALWNLQNEYNTPAAQMSRYQQAGLNPNLIYSQSNTASSPAGSTAPIPAKATNFQAQNKLSAIDTAGRIVQGINNIIGQVRQTYDYVNYGMDASALRNKLYREQIYNTQTQGQMLENQKFISDILSGRYGADLTGPKAPRFVNEYTDPEIGQRYADIPYVARYLNQNELTAENLEKLQRYLEEMFPLEKEYMRAGSRLRESEFQWNDNIRQFVGSINTGVPWLDQLLKAAMRVAIQR